MKVLVCDDLEARAVEVAESILDGQPDAEVTTLTGDKLTAELTLLFERVERCLKKPAEYVPEENTALDTAELVVFDNNLAHLSIKGARLTAESVVGYVRAFTNARFIVSINKNPDVDFDLRYLVGDYETRADLALNTNHLENASLWSGRRQDARTGFRPWYWPSLDHAPRRREEQVADVCDRLAENVLAALHIPTDESVLSFLSLHGRGALSPDIAVEAITFADVFRGKARSLPDREERESLASAQDNEHVKQLIARVVAADIDLWFRRDLVGPQELLVDLPHLLLRMPFLLGTHATNADGWNAALDETHAPFGMERAIYEEHVASSLYRSDCWLHNGPVFFWPELKNRESLNNLFLSVGAPEWPDLVFCEDTSRFCERGVSGEDLATEFMAEFEGAWARRYVENLADVGYAPRGRLAR